jgi:bacteriocin-like protein
MEEVMTSQSNDTPAKAELSDNELNAVVGGQDKFQYVDKNGNTYAVGYIQGQTVMVKVI